MARGTSPVMTAVSMNCPIAGRFLSSWERDNSVIVRENKTTDSSAQRCLWLVAWICIWMQQAFKGAYLLCKVAFMHTFDTGHLPCACRQIDLFAAQFAPWNSFHQNHADWMLIPSKGCSTKYLEFTSPENFMNKPFWTFTDLNILPKAVKLHYWYNIWPAVD